MENSSSNVTKQELEYSNLAILLFIGLPILIYLVSAMMTKDLSGSINLNGQPKVDEFATALFLFCMRIGSIVLACIGVYKSFFTIPNEKTARWMVKDSQTK